MKSKWSAWLQPIALSLPFMIVECADPATSSRRTDNKGGAGSTETTGAGGNGGGGASGGPGGGVSTGGGGPTAGGTSGTGGGGASGGGAGLGGASGSAGSAGQGGAAGRGGAAGSAGSSAGAAGAIIDAGSDGQGGATDGGLSDGPTNPGTCSGLTPAGTAMCAPMNTCRISVCGPPIEYVCAVAGTVAEDNTCTSDSDCAAGLTCLTDKTSSVCHKYCAADTDCATGHRCLGAFNSRCQGVTGKNCLMACNDITSAGAAACGMGFKCAVSCGASGGGAVCLQAGTATSGACSSESDCAVGYACAGSTCRQACKADADCSTGKCSGALACGSTSTGFKFCQ